MQEKHYRKIVTVLNQRNRRRSLLLVNAALYAILFALARTPYLTYPGDSNLVPFIWIPLILLQLVYVIVQDMRGRLLITQIESRYGWDDFEDEEDKIAEKRKRLYTGDDDGELVEWDETVEQQKWKSISGQAP